MQTYEHRQVGYFFLILWAVSALAIVLGGVASGEGLVVAIAVGGVLLLLSLCFVWLTVSDGGDHLSIAFGPLALFRRRVPYHEIDAAVATRTSLMEGWGIHLVPGRGWTWNIWGRDCVELTLGQRRLRIGTDDAEGLERFLQERIRR